MATNGKHIEQKTKSVNALRKSKGDVECCRTAFRFRITNIVKKLARVPKNDKIIEPTNATVEEISSIITTSDILLTIMLTSLQTDSDNDFFRHDTFIYIPRISGNFLEIPNFLEVVMKYVLVLT